MTSIWLKAKLELRKSIILKITTLKSFSWKYKLFSCSSTSPEQYNKTVRNLLIPLFFSDALYICHNCFIFCDSFFICSSFNTQYFTFIIMHWQFGLNQAEQHCTLSVQSCSYSTTVQPGLSRGSVDYSSNQVSPVCTRSFQSIIDIDHHNFR